MVPPPSNFHAYQDHLDAGFFYLLVCSAGDQTQGHAHVHRLGKATPPCQLVKMLCSLGNPGKGPGSCMLNQHPGWGCSSGVELSTWQQTNQIIIIKKVSQSAADVTSSYYTPREKLFTPEHSLGPVSRSLPTVSDPLPAAFSPTLKPTL
jgi:hypothetical protein